MCEQTSAQQKCWATYAEQGASYTKSEATFALRILSNKKRAVTLDNEDHLQTLREPVRAIAMVMLSGVIPQLCPVAVTGRTASKQSGLKQGTQGGELGQLIQQLRRWPQSIQHSTLFADDKHLAFKGTEGF